MALNASGLISIGGSTVGQSVNLELYRSATAASNLNESAFRTLAGVPSGTISLDNFHGKANYATMYCESSSNPLGIGSLFGYNEGMGRGSLTPNHTPEGYHVYRVGLIDGTTTYFLQRIYIALVNIPSDVMYLTLEVLGTGSLMLTRLGAWTPEITEFTVDVPDVAWEYVFRGNPTRQIKITRAVD